MIVAVHQPNYLPYLGFFHKMALADRFVLYDTAQFSKNEFHNRNRIKTPRGPMWLSVPVRRLSGREIREVDIDGSREWASQHWEAIHANLSRAPYFETYTVELRRVYQEPWDRLASLNERLVSELAAWLRVKTPVVRTSELNIPTDLSPSGKLAAITESVGGTAYLSGPGGVEYLDPAAFAGIDLMLQDFRHPQYPQLWGGFLPNLSSLDMLCNVGDRAGDVLQACGGMKPWPRERASARDSEPQLFSTRGENPH